MRIRYQNDLDKHKRSKQLKAFGFVMLTFAFSFVLLSLNFSLPELIDQISANTPPTETLSANYTDTNIERNEGDATYKSSVKTQDPRAYVLDQYFKANNSPMTGTGQIIIDSCIRYNAPQDCLIVAAIADAETDLCKYHTSASYYNCWGYGGGGANRIYFSNWRQSIDAVYRTLATSGLYGNDVMKDPRLMERTFCGWEPGCTGWGLRVIYYMDEIDQFAKNIGIKQGMYGFR